MMTPPCSRALGVIAVAPDVGEALEIGGAVFLAVRVVPEAERHATGRGGCRPARPSRRSAARSPSSSEDVDRHAEHRAPCIRRATPGPAGSPMTKQRHDVGAARDRGEADVALDGAIDVVEAFGRQRRAGRGHRPHRVELVGRHRLRARPWRRRRCTWPRCRRASCAPASAKSNRALPSGWKGEPS